MSDTPHNYVHKAFHQQTVDALAAYIARLHLADGLRRAGVVLRQSEHLRMLGEAIDAAGLTVTFDGVPMSGPGATPKAKVDALFARLDALTAERDGLSQRVADLELEFGAITGISCGACVGVGHLHPDHGPCACCGGSGELSAEVCIDLIKEEARRDGAQLGAWYAARGAKADDAVEAAMRDLRDRDGGGVE